MTDIYLPTPSAPSGGSGSAGSGGGLSAPAITTLITQALLEKTFKGVWSATEQYDLGNTVKHFSTSVSAGTVSTLYEALSKPTKGVIPFTVPNIWRPIVAAFDDSGVEYTGLSASVISATNAASVST